MHVLLIDSPVGVGFSYYDDPVEHRAKNDDQVVEDLFVLLNRFFRVHHDLINAPLHIFGHSYGAKTAVKLALMIHKQKNTPIPHWNLQSVTSISGWISPSELSSAYAPFLMQMGFIDKQRSSLLSLNTKYSVEQMKAEQYVTALHMDTYLMQIIEGIFGVDTNNVLMSVAAQNNAESNFDHLNAKFNTENDI